MVVIPSQRPFKLKYDLTSETGILDVDVTLDAKLI